MMGSILRRSHVSLEYIAVRGVARDRREHDRVAVGRGFDRHIGAHMTARARTVFDDDPLVVERPSRCAMMRLGEIGHAAGRVWHNHAYRLSGVRRTRALCLAEVDRPEIARGPTIAALRQARTM